MHVMFTCLIKKNNKCEKYYYNWRTGGKSNMLNKTCQGCWESISCKVILFSNPHYAIVIHLPQRWAPSHNWAVSVSNETSAVCLYRFLRAYQLAVIFSSWLFLPHSLQPTRKESNICLSFPAVHKSNNCVCNLFKSNNILLTHLRSFKLRVISKPPGIPTSIYKL